MFIAQPDQIFAMARGKTKNTENLITEGPPSNVI